MPPWAQGVETQPPSSASHSGPVQPTSHTHEDLPWREGFSPAPPNGGSCDLCLAQDSGPCFRPLPSAAPLSTPPPSAPCPQCHAGQVLSKRLSEAPALGLSAAALGAHPEALVPRYLSSLPPGPHSQPSPAPLRRAPQNSPSPCGLHGPPQTCPLSSPGRGRGEQRAGKLPLAVPVLAGAVVLRGGTARAAARAEAVGLVLQALAPWLGLAQVGGTQGDLTEMTWGGEVGERQGPSMSSMGQRPLMYDTLAVRESSGATRAGAPRQALPAFAPSPALPRGRPFLRPPRGRPEKCPLL